MFEKWKSMYYDAKSFQHLLVKTLEMHFKKDSMLGYGLRTKSKLYDKKNELVKIMSEKNLITKSNL